MGTDGGGVRVRHRHVGAGEDRGGQVGAGEDRWASLLTHYSEVSDPD